MSLIVVLHPSYFLHLCLSYMLVVIVPGTRRKHSHSVLLSERGRSRVLHSSLSIYGPPWLSTRKDINHHHLQWSEGLAP
jgi:hypothetical protein